MRPHARQLPPEYYVDPVLFACGILGDTLWRKQVEILEAVRDNRMVAVKACHASSKSFTAAEILLWWLVRWRDGIVITLASTFTQVKDVLWQEVHRAVRRGEVMWPAGTRINDTEIRLAPGNYALGLSPESAVNIHGFHSEHILIILDEAPGIRAEIWDAIEGARASGNVRLLALGNPTIPGGPFYEAFTRDRGLWKTITIDAFETPNLEELTEADFDMMQADLRDSDPFFAHCPVPYLASRRWVYEQAKKYGINSAIWQSKVRGQFPQQGEDALISLAWIERARKPPKELVIGENEDALGLHAGVDVADGGGDETVCIVREGRRLIAMGAWTHDDCRGEVAAFLAPYRQRIREVSIDKAGMGAYFCHHFETDLGYNVNAINVGEKTDFPDRFANLKAQLYWSLRETFQEGAIYGIDDELMISQLASLRYELTPRGLIAIEKKEVAAKRGVKSPDRAEALMLAFAARAPGSRYVVEELQL